MWNITVYLFIYFYLPLPSPKPGSKLVHALRSFTSWGFHIPGPHFWNSSNSLKQKAPVISNSGLTYVRGTKLYLFADQLGQDIAPPEEAAGSKVEHSSTG